MTPHVLTIVGSTRQGRKGGAIGRWFAGLADQRDDLTHELVDLRDWPLPFFDDPIPPAMGQPSQHDVVRAWGEKVASADGYVLVVPEYNHGYPAVLKNALDSVFSPWLRKPVSFVGYGGPGAGVRAVEQLRQVVVELEMAPLRHQVSIARAYMSLDAEGRPTEDWHEQDAQRLLDEHVWWARALAAARAPSEAAVA